MYFNHVCPRLERVAGPRPGERHDTPSPLYGLWGKSLNGGVTLRPELVFAGGERPSAAQHEAMHDEAHEQCFIANSVKTTVRCEAVDRSA